MKQHQVKQEPQSKRLKSDDVYVNHEEEDDNYDEAVANLLSEWKKGRRGRNQAMIKSIMEKTEKKSKIGYQQKDL